jgi:hypothetical protein
MKWPVFSPIVKDSLGQDFSDSRKRHQLLQCCGVDVDRRNICFGSILGGSGVQAADIQRSGGEIINEIESNGSQQNQYGKGNGYDSGCFFHGKALRLGLTIVVKADIMLQNIIHEFSFPDKSGDGILR